ncbi:hypothetical protein ACVINW_001323 [Bradyrhizobium sp. USDA 4461]
MTRFFFDYHPSDGDATTDEVGEELEDLDAARVKALAAVGDAAFDEARAGHEFSLTISIRDGTRPVGRASVILTVS